MIFVTSLLKNLSRLTSVNAKLREELRKIKNKINFKANMLRKDIYFYIYYTNVCSTHIHM